MEEFAWRPAALRSEQKVRIATDGLTLDRGDRIAWGEVDAISFALDQARRITMMTLRLRVGDSDVTLSVSGDGPEIARYVEMVRALTGTLAAARPDLTITIGHEGGARWGMFLVGALGVLVGVCGVGAGIYLTIEDGLGEGVGIGFVGLVVGLMCSAIALSNLPFGARPQAPLAEFRASLDLPAS